MNPRILSIRNALLLMFPEMASAHGQLLQDGIWSAWSFTPEIGLPLLATLAIYLRGWWKRRGKKKQPSLIQTLAFILGILCFFIALQSPLEPLSNHFLFVHQIEHLLLRVFAPLLIILSMPLAPLIQGLPPVVRHHAIAPLTRSRIMQGLYAFLSHPLVASLSFLATLIVWQIPGLHDRAVQDPFLHDTMHISMIFSGFFFWWLIADPRQQTARLSYGIRLITLWLVTLPNSLLGAYITLNRFPLYSVYDVLEGHWHIERLLDQQLGGILIWGPGAMMGVIGTGVICLVWVRNDRQNGLLSSHLTATM